MEYPERRQRPRPAVVVMMMIIIIMADRQTRYYYIQCSTRMKVGFGIGGVCEGEEEEVGEWEGQKRRRYCN